LDFTLDASVITQQVSDTLTSFSPLLLIIMSLAFAGGVIAWGIGALKRWRSAS
jgi:hypothetical protein